MYTKTQWEHYEKMQGDLEGIADTFVRKFCDRWTCVQGFMIEDGRIVIQTEANYSGCGTEYDGYDMPISYLWSEDWVQEEMYRREAQKQARLEQERKHKKVQEDLRIEKEKEQYLKLQNKYGDKNV